MGPAPPVSPPAASVALERAATAETVACLKGERWTSDARHVVVRTTGLGLPPNSVAARVADAPNGLLVYQDGGGSVIECGVIVLRPLPAGASDRLASVIEAARPRFRPANASAQRPYEPPQLLFRYWNDPLAPGLGGVLVGEGGDGVCSPCLRVDSHSVLVR